MVDDAQHLYSWIDGLPWKVLRLSLPTIPRFALTDLAVLELAAPAFRQLPTESHTFPQYRASGCPRTHTPQSTSLPPPSTLAPANQYFQVPYLSSQSSPRPLSYSNISLHLLFLSERSGYRGMLILRHSRRFNPTLAWQRKLSGWPRSIVFTLVVWLEDKTMEDRYQTWGLGAFSSFLTALTSTCSLCVSGF